MIYHIFPITVGPYLKKDFSILCCLNYKISYFNPSFTNSLNFLPLSSMSYFPSKIITLVELIFLPIPY